MGDVEASGAGHGERTAGVVRTRRLYYLSGFDPRGPRHYHQLWQHEAARQKAVDGRSYGVGARSTGPLAARWTVTAEAEGDHTETRVAFLRWDDLIRRYWPASPWRVLARLPAFYRDFAGCGGLGDALRRRPESGLILLAPVLHLLIALLLAALAAWGVDALLARVHPLAGHLGAVGAAALVLWLAVVQAERVKLFWLARIHLFMHEWGRTAPADLAQRWEQLAAVIQDDLAADAASGTAADEVLVVGHSVGAAVAVAVVERWLALQGGVPGNVPIKLLTLGQVIPMVARMREAGEYRRQLAIVRDCSVPWLDMTAPADLLCYALKDPFTASGMAGTVRPGYRMKSSRFDRMFDASMYRQLRRDFFRVHFQYLMASQRPVDNDFFQLACGSRPLEAS